MSKQRTLLLLAGIALLFLVMSVAFRSRNTDSGIQSDELAAAHEAANDNPSAGPAKSARRLPGGAAGAAAAPAANAEQVTVDCEECRETQCTNYQGSGVNLINGCFKAVDPSQGADTSDPRFLEDCMAAVRCAHKNHCGDPPKGAAGCYCGSESLDDCVEHGPAADAPCREEWRRATRSQKNDEIMLRMSDLKYPSGWALPMIECDVVACKGKCSR